MSVCIVCLVAFAGLVIVSITYPYDLEMYEGPIFAPAMRLMAGQPAFGREIVLNEPYIFAAYGPFYYALVGTFLHFSGLSFWPGRLLSALATVGTFLMIFQAIVKTHRDRETGLIASTLFAVMPVTWAFGALQRVDAVATLFAFLPIYILLVHPSSRFLMCLAGLAAGVGFLTKPTAIAGICAVIIWLLLRRQWSTLIVLISGLGLSLAIAGGILVVSGNSGYVYNQTVNLRTPFEIPSILSRIRLLIQNPVVLASLIFVMLAARRRGLEHNPRESLALLYVVTAAAFNIASATRHGASINHFGELAIALSLCAGLEIYHWLRSSNSGAKLAAMLLMTAVLVAMVGSNLGSYRGRFLIPMAKARLYEEVIRQLQQTLEQDEPVATEYPDLVLRAERPLFFSDLAMYQAGPPEVREVLIRTLGAKRVGAVVTMGSWDLPGYVRVQSIAYTNPKWAPTRHYEGPFLYLREDLFRRFEMRNKG